MRRVPRISESEWEVLSILWKKAPLAATQVFEKLAGKSWKLSTVRTFLARLEKKGVVKSLESREAKTYRPAISREECVREASQSFLNRVFEGATASLLIHFAQSKRLSPRDLAELESIIAQKRKEK
ncbi:MAG: BlaI/MecI/CopY family transcriptional regulator [Chthoniobacter sp.]